MLIWIHDLKRDSIHKKIMETAKDLRDDKDFDYEESIERSISIRKTLLNRLVPAYENDMDYD